MGSVLSEGRERSKEGVGSLQIGRRQFYKQREFAYNACHHQMFNVYTERGLLSPVCCTGILSSNHHLKAVSLQHPWEQESNESAHSKDRGWGKEPQIACVQLRSQLVFTSS